MEHTKWRSLEDTFTWNNDGGAGSGGVPDAEFFREGAVVGDRYRLQGPIGAGGMSTVYRALDRLTGEVVALKQMSAPSRLPSETLDAWHQTEDEAQKAPDLGSSARLRYALAREFQTLSALRHPNIISVLDYGFHNDSDPFYTMELLSEARDIEEAAQLVDDAGKIELLVETLRALAYLHRRGVLHRDLKPANILVTDRVRVLDFGVAARSGDPTMRRAGTLGFIPPEVYRHQPMTRAGDLFAVGVIAFRMFSDEHPFDAASSKTLKRSILRDTPRYRLLRADPPVVDVIRRLLDKDPARRFASAEETIDALAAAASLPIRRETRQTRESFLQAAAFVDRDDERAALDAAVAALHRGEGGVMLLAGPSGIGKSRLIDELQTLIKVLGLQVVRGQTAAEAGDAFELWAAPLRRLLLYGLPEDTQLSVLKVLIDDLSQLLEREIPDTPLSPQGAKDQVVAAIQGLLQAQNQPTVVLLEDLHWGRESVDVLSGLSDALADRPVLVVGTYRPEEASATLQALPAQRLRLSPLGSADVAALAAGMLGEGAGRVVPFLERHTEGNPFFVVETVRALAEEAGRLDRVSTAPLPERIETAGIDDLVRRRLGLVAPEQRPLLEWCAVLGRQPDLAVVRHALGAEAVEQGLLVLAELGLLESRDNRWRFSHDRFRETLLTELSDSPALHRRAAAAIESTHGATPEVAAVLAYHHGAAGDLPEEGRFAALAGQRAQQLGAYREAGDWLRRALALHPHRTGLDAPAAEELSLCLALGTVIMPTEGWASDETRRLYARVLALAEETGQTSQVGPALMGQCLMNIMSGRVRTALGFAEQLCRLSEQTDDPIMMQHALVMRGQASHWLADHDETVALTEQSLTLFAPEQLPQHFARYSWDPRMAARVCFPWTCWITGATDRAVEVVADGLAIEAAGPNPFSRAMLLQSSGWVSLLRRDIDQTAADAAALRSVSEEYGFTPFLVLATFLEGWAAVQRGEHDAGLQTLRPAFAAWAETGSALVTTFYTMVFADACLTAGATEDGLEAVEHALSGALPTEECCYDPELHRLQGELLRARGELPAAEASLRAALALSSEQQAASWTLRAATSLAALLQTPDSLAALQAARDALADQRPSADTRRADAVLTGASDA